MATETKLKLFSAFWVSLISAVVILLYLFVPIETPYYWACYIPWPVAFIVGATVKNVPKFTFNALLGLVGGICCFAVCGVLTPIVGIYGSFFIGVFVLTFILLLITIVWLGDSIGLTPMAFVGWIACFAAGQTDIVTVATLAISMFVGILFGCVISWGDTLALKIFKVDPAELTGSPEAERIAEGKE